MNPLQKRTNPFASTVIEEAVQEREEPKEIVEESNYIPQPIIKNQQKSQRQTQKQIVQQKLYREKDKYTATMDTELRTNIKIVCARSRIKFSDYIETACQEKLKRDGVI